MLPFVALRLALQICAAQPPAHVPGPLPLPPHAARLVTHGLTLAHPNHVSAAIEHVDECMAQWGAQLGPPLCHAVFRESTTDSSLSLEWQLLRVLMSLGQQKAAVLWNSGRQQATGALRQLNVMLQAEADR